MAVYCVMGKMGSGKSLVCVGRIREALSQHRRVATNLDLRLEHLVKGGARTNVTRIRDHPRLDDFEALGWGSPEAQHARPGQMFDEKRNGIIVLDEISSILDARNWQGKERALLIDWLKQSRKRGWDIYFIAQHDSMIDTLVRKSLFEMDVICKRLDRLPIPIIGWLFKAFGLSGNFMRVHIASVVYARMVSERWIYRGNDLFAAYNTRQVFRPERSPHLAPGEPDDNPQGHYSVLDPFTAPWLRAKRGWRWAVSDLLERRCKPLWRVLGGVLEPGPVGSWFDFWMCENLGPPVPSKEAREAPRFEAWWLPLETALWMDRVIDQERARRLGPLGGVQLHAGEAVEPAQAPHQQAA